MKTNMVKDLKYLSYKNFFLIGDNPLKGENIEGNVLLFGDCAIRSSKNPIQTKTKKSKKKTSTKFNNKVMKLYGCPPDIFKNIELLLKMYDRDDLPMLNLIEKLYGYYRPKNLKEKLEKWEAI